MQKNTEAYIEMTKYPSDETKNEHSRLLKGAMKEDATATKDEAVGNINKLCINP